MNRILSIGVKWVHDETPDLSWLTDADRYSDVENTEERERYEREDAERLKAFHDGEWFMEGCWAQAEVVVEGTCQRIKSGGLWGIESDSEKGYREEVEQEQRAELLGILAALGFDTIAETLSLLDSVLAEVTR